MLAGVSIFYLLNSYVLLYHLISKSLSDTHILFTQQSSEATMGEGGVPSARADGEIAELSRDHFHNASIRSSFHYIRPDWCFHQFQVGEVLVEKTVFQTKGQVSYYCYYH